MKIDRTLMQRAFGLRRAAALAVGLGLLMTACAKHAPQDTLKPAGKAARSIDHLFVGVFWIAAFFFVLVEEQRVDEPLQDRQT